MSEGTTPPKPAGRNISQKIGSPAAAPKMITESWGMSAVIYKSPRIELRLLTIKAGKASPPRFHKRVTKVYIAADGELNVSLASEPPDGIAPSGQVALKTDGVPIAVTPGTWYSFSAGSNDAVAYELTVAIAQSAIDSGDVQVAGEVPAEEPTA